MTPGVNSDSSPRPNPTRRSAPFLLLAVLAVALLAFYAVFAQRYVGASDWYGYYQEGVLFRHGRVTLPTELPAAAYPAQAPLGFIVDRGRTISQYTPGYPVLLALAGLAGLDFYVTPLVGFLSCVLMFRIIRRRTDPWTALLFALLWSLSPIVIWGSTQLMSDLVAATSLMLVYELCLARKPAWAGAAFVFAVAVRPTDGLFVLLLPVLLPGWRGRIRAVLGGLAPAVAYGAYNLVNFGAPWKTGYMDVRSDILAGFAGRNLAFYGTRLLAEVGPLALLLAVAGFVRLPKRGWIHAAWFSLFIGFYVFWRYPGNDSTWWWFRFVLPGLPPVFVLAADGFACMRRTLAGGRLAGSAPALSAAVVLALLVAPVESLRFCRREDVIKSTKGIEYRNIVRDAERLMPPGAWLGSVEFSGSTRLYTHLGSFMSTQGDAPALVARLIHDGKAVYLLVEPWNATNATITTLLQRYHGQQTHRFGLWGGVTLYRLGSARLTKASP